MSEQIAFTFALAGTQKDEVFQVLTFTGDEGISRLFEFNIELLSDNADADIDAILQQPATLTLTQGDDVRVIQGIVSHFDAVRQINNQILYKARLVPRLWELSLYHTNEVYLDMTVPEIIEAVLTEGGFETVDYEINDLQGDYKKWAYKCQYGETHLDFISRLMERDGIYYYFTQGDVGEKVVFCDQLTMQDSLPEAVVQYSAASSLEINALPNTVHSFVSQQKRVPHRVMLKDYNDDKPSVDVKGEAIIDDSANKSSEIYVWGQNIETPEEGEQLAQIRAEQILAGKKVFHGESSVNRLIPGYFFTMQGHFRSASNQDYCLLGLHHEGTNRRLIDGANSEQAPAYYNEMMAQPADVQYRPALETPRPEIHGVLNAYVDSEGDGHYAEIDEEGRYRILLPFDRVDRDGGKASHWIRMSQPFAGENQGMHFPLRKNTEVLLTFVGGDPDRPVISGSMPNAGAPSVINSENHTNSLIQTQAGNRIELEDKDGKNRIKFETPQSGTYMHLGAPNHPGDGWVVVTNGMERKQVTGGMQYTMLTGSTASTLSTETNLDSSSSGIEYDNSVSTDGVPLSTFAFVERYSPLANDSSDQEAKAKRFTSVPGSSDQNDLTKVAEWSLTETSDNSSDSQQGGELSGDYIITRIKGTRYFWMDGIEFNYGEGNIYSFGNSYEITHWNRFDDTEAAGLVSTYKGYNVVGLIPYSGNPDHADRSLDTEEERLKGLADSARTEYQMFLVAENASYISSWDVSAQERGILERKNYDSNYFSNIGLDSHSSNDLIGLVQNLDEIIDQVDSWYDSDGSSTKFISSTTKADIKLYLGKVKDYCNKFKDYKEYKENADWGYLISKGEFEVKQTDTFTAQNGNIYDFGGYWNYNLGNSYEENHINQNAEINKKSGKDKAAQGGPLFGKATGNTVTVDASTAWVTKNYGDSYEYTKGNNLEVIEGDVESLIHGDSYNLFKGDMEDHFRGTTHATYYGASSDFFLGASTDLRIGAASEMKLGGGNNVNAIIWTDIELGLKLELNKGGEVKLDKAYSVAKKKLVTVAEDIKIQKHKAAIRKLKAECYKKDSDLGDIASQVIKIKAKIESSKAKIEDVKAEIKKVTISSWM